MRASSSQVLSDSVIPGSLPVWPGRRRPTTMSVAISRVRSPLAGAPQRLAGRADQQYQGSEVHLGYMGPGRWTDPLMPRAGLPRAETRSLLVGL